MTVHNISAVFAVPASGPGALDGFAVECSCGERAAFSFRQMAVDHGAAHVAYFERQTARGRRRK